MAKMKKLTPRMQALKERFGDDRKKFSEALMKIYTLVYLPDKEHWELHDKK